MKRAHLVVLAAVIVLTSSAFAQAAPPTPTPPGCRALVDGLKSKIEADYAGFVLEVKGARLAQYADFVSRLRDRADTTGPADCFGVLRALTGWFADPHLFIVENGALDTAESRARQARVTRMPLDEAAARRYLAGTRLDPIEGIWSDGTLRVAVVHEAGAARNRFVAVVLTPDTSTWQPGFVRARFVRQGDGAYEATVAARNFAETHPRAVVHKRVLLRLSPLMWGKVFPVAAADSGLVDPDDPHRPTLLVRGRTVIVSMTSHQPQYKAVLDSLVATHAAELRGAQRLIVDLRGNEGGSASTGDALLPYISSEAEAADPANFRDAVMLSSPDQIRYVTRAFGDSNSTFVQSLLGRLRASPGGFVPVIDPASPANPVERDSVIRGPARVAVLTDGGTVSAAEVLVLQARRSARARIYGEPTEGALDYQSTSLTRILPTETRWYLGYPTITASTRLPEGGMRGIGIIPDVRITWRDLADPLRAIEHMMEGR